MSHKAWKRYQINTRAREIESNIPKLRYRDFHKLLREIRIISGEKLG